MITINIKPKFIEEKKYVIDTIFDNILGLPYSIKLNPERNYHFILSNEKSISFEDNFFDNFEDTYSYIHKNNIPSDVIFTVNEFTTEHNIPVIFGNEKLSIEKNEIKCGIDIIASIFFMLSRWEEAALSVRDKHGRFPHYASLAYRHNFLNRPVVNEYAEMLWNMLKTLGYKQQRKTRTFRLMVTHDVDHIQKYAFLHSGLVNIAADLMKRKSLHLAGRNIKQKIRVHAGIEKDPYCSFDLLMDLSEKVGVQSHFFFMAHGLTKYDNYYESGDIKVKKLVEHIISRGHCVGIHPTYSSYNNQQKLNEEKEELETNFGVTINYGRQHYLRFEVPGTWQIWDDLNMSWDSTAGYPNMEGFRCGICNEFNPFNVLTRKKLSLKEKPLMLMDSMFNIYSNRSLNASIISERTMVLLDRVKKYNGEFVILWHNSSLNVPMVSSYQHVYKQALGL